MHVCTHTHTRMHTNLAFTVYDYVCLLIGHRVFAWCGAQLCHFPPHTHTPPSLPSGCAAPAPRKLLVGHSDQLKLFRWTCFHTPTTTSLSCCLRGLQRGLQQALWLPPALPVVERTHTRALVAKLCGLLNVL